ncbi:UNVERIFIED_CONTAM: hypothetical protein HDU68_012516 [Siphonaria sp. JEL0065]|nr:hypothetical protein HDU68_012516 [Siphonaria sp. JEL0065]
MATKTRVVRLNFQNAPAGQQPAPVRGYSDVGEQFRLGAHSHHATEAPASALLAPIGEQPAWSKLNKKPLFVLSGSVCAGPLSKPAQSNVSSVSVDVELWIAVYCGACPLLPGGFTEDVGVFDPLDLARTSRVMHGTPLFSTKTAIPLSQANPQPDGSTIYDFKLLVPKTNGLEPTIIFTEKKNQAKTTLAGTSTFVFVILKTKNPKGIVETAISGREAIIQHQYQVPSLESLLPATIRYPVKEIKASLSMAKFVSLFPEPPLDVDDDVRAILSDFKMSLFITDWNPLIQILKAKCQWIEVIEEPPPTYTIPHDDTSTGTSTTADYNESTNSKLKTGKGIVRSTRTIMSEEVEVIDVASPEMGGFQHAFSPPDFSQLHPTSVSPYFIVSHTVTVTITFCRIDKDYDTFSMDVSFRNVMPRFRFLGTMDVAGPYLNGKEHGEPELVPVEESRPSTSKKLFDFFSRKSVASFADSSRSSLSSRPSASSIPQQPASTATSPYGSISVLSPQHQQRSSTPSTSSHLDQSQRSTTSPFPGNQIFNPPTPTTSVPSLSPSAGGFGVIRTQKAQDPRSQPPSFSATSSPGIPSPVPLPASSGSGGFKILKAELANANSRTDYFEPSSKPQATPIQPANGSLSSSSSASTVFDSGHSSNQQQRPPVKSSGFGILSVKPAATASHFDANNYSSQQQQQQPAKASGFGIISVKPAGASYSDSTNKSGIHSIKSAATAATHFDTNISSQQQQQQQQHQQQPAKTTGFGILSVKPATAATHFQQPQGTITPAGQNQQSNTATSPQGRGFGILNARPAPQDSNSTTASPSFFDQTKQPIGPPSSSASPPSTSSSSLSVNGGGVPAPRRSFGVIRVQQDTTNSSGFFDGSSANSSTDNQQHHHRTTPEFDVNSETISSASISSIRSPSVVHGKASILSFASVTESMSSAKDVSTASATTGVAVMVLPPPLVVGGSMIDSTSSLKSRESFIAERVDTVSIVGGGGAVSVCDGRSSSRTSGPPIALNKTYKCIESGYAEVHAEYPSLTSDDDAEPEAGEGLVWGKNTRTDKNGHFLLSKLDTSAPVLVTKKPATAAYQKPTQSVSWTVRAGASGSMAGPSSSSSHPIPTYDEHSLSLTDPRKSQFAEAVGAPLGFNPTEDGEEDEASLRRRIEKPFGLEIMSSHDSGERQEVALEDFDDGSLDCLRITKGDVVVFNVGLRDGEFVYGVNLRSNEQGRFKLSIFGPQYGKGKGKGKEDTHE